MIKLGWWFNNQQLIRHAVEALVVVILNGAI